LKEYEVHLLPYLCSWFKLILAFNLNKPEEARIIKSIRFNLSNYESAQVKMELADICFLKKIKH
jgi:hypothetical protein